MKMNKHYNELKASYLFVDIAHKVAAYQEAHPEKEIIRLGIGDVTQPLAKCVVQAMRDAAEEMGTKEGFHATARSRATPSSSRPFRLLRQPRHPACRGRDLYFGRRKERPCKPAGAVRCRQYRAGTGPVYPTYVDDNVTDGRKIITAAPGRKMASLACRTRA